MCKFRRRCLPRRDTPLSHFKKIPRFGACDKSRMAACQRANRRHPSRPATSSHYPIVRTSPTNAWLIIAGSPPSSNSFDNCTGVISSLPAYSQSARHQLTSSTSCGLAEPGVTPTIPQSSHFVPWDAEADTVTIGAYSEGKCLDLIREEGSLHGYDATQSNVSRSLYSQGITRFYFNFKRPWYKKGIDWLFP